MHMHNMHNIIILLLCCNFYFFLLVFDGNCVQTSVGLHTTRASAALRGLSMSTPRVAVLCCYVVCVNV